VGSRTLKVVSKLSKSLEIRLKEKFQEQSINHKSHSKITYVSSKNLQELARTAPSMINKP
jgi:hypothetical protein